MATVSITDTMDVSCFGVADGAIEFIVDLDPNTVEPTQTIISDGLNEFSNGALSAGQFCVLVEDANNCVAGGACFEIASPAPITLLSNSTEACNDSGGTIDLQVVGGTTPYTYAWSNLPPGNDPGFPNQSNLPPGFYGLTITDSQNCVSTLDSLEVPFCEACDLYPNLTPFWFKLAVMTWRVFVWIFQTTTLAIISFLITMNLTPVRFNIAISPLSGYIH